MDQKASAKVLVLDFGAQYGQLIARRVRDLNVYSEIVPCDISADEIREMNASALILSGGPASVYAEDAPSIDPAIFDLGLPVLGFCYGHQITAVTLGGKVGHSEVGEYGRATITRTAGAKLFNSTPMEQTVWMSHRDAVSEVPEGFTVTASTDVCPVAAMECVERKIFTTQFHPEVKHSEYGQQLLTVLGVLDFGVELRGEDFALDALHRSDRAHVGAGGNGKALGHLGNGVAVAHPHGLLHGRGVKELGAGRARDGGAAVLAHLGVADLAAERHGRDLMAVAKAQDGKAQVKDGGIDRRSVLGIHGSRAAGKDERRGVHLANLVGRDVAGDDLGIHVEVADATGNELTVLRTKVEYEDLCGSLLIHGSPSCWRGAGAHPRE